MLSIPESLMTELTLRHPRDGELLGQVGLTAKLYYAQDMTELADVFRLAAETYMAFIPPNTINFYNNHEDWRPYKARSLNRLFNRFTAKDDDGYWLDFAQLAYAEDEDGSYAIDSVGNYGFGFAGRNRARSGWDSDVCAIQCEFPHNELLRSGVEPFIAFVEGLAGFAPFDSGHVGFSFKHDPHTGGNQECPWISFKAPRFLAIHPYHSNYEHYTRHRLANVNWLTLLGTELSEKLGGIDVMRATLSDAVTVKSLKYGTMLMAGETPPLGDVNQQAPDLGPLREVARLTRPCWLDDATLSNDILNSFWHEPEDREAWINRFERTF